MISTVITRVIVSQTYVHALCGPSKRIYIHRAMRQAVRRTASRASRPRIGRRGGAAAALAHRRAHLDGHDRGRPGSPRQASRVTSRDRRAATLLTQRPTCRGGKKAAVGDLPPTAPHWPRAAKSGLSGPSMGSSNRMPSAVGASAKVRAHANRTDRPFQEGPAERSERSAVHRMCVRLGARAAAHHERVENARLDKGRAQLLPD